jgi:predicted transcriptional regulator
MEKNLSSRIKNFHLDCKTDKLLDLLAKGEDRSRSSIVRLAVKKYYQEVKNGK